jgi:hypothetical protein
LGNIIKIAPLAGWYTCTAYGVGGTSVSAEAYLEIRDICAEANCEDPKVNPKNKIL